MSVDRARAVLQLASREIAEARSLVRVHDRIARALGPDIAAWAVADNRAETDADKRLASWEPTRKPLLILFSVPGLGKTTSAARWTATRGGLILPADEVDRWPFDGGPGLRRAMGARLLMVDDIGREREHSRRIMANILARRHDARRPTVCTTMIPSSKAAQYYPDDVRDRAVWVNLSRGRSMRESKVEPATRRLKIARALLDVHARVLAVASGAAVDEVSVARLMKAIEADEAAVLARIEVLAEQDRETKAAALEALEHLGAQTPDEDRGADAGALAWLDALEVPP